MCNVEMYSAQCVHNTDRKAIKTITITMVKIVKTLKIRILQYND